ncbi:MAG: 4-amino-4-deoxychorismate lyase [Pseudohongiellaceae bacterium]|jgi:4-amino-4-deoxychorismate lyase
MQTLINGYPNSSISVMDRGFLYGDGAFETLAVIDGRPILLPQHLARLESACKLLKISFNADIISDELLQLSNQAQGSRVAKIIITRGEGGRGYKPNLDSIATRIIQLFEPSVPNSSGQEISGVCITVCQHRLSQSTALAGVKHLNRLDQVLASAELDENFYEGLCLDIQGNVIEATKSNLLVFSNGNVLSPDLSLSGVKGIMLMEISKLLARDGYLIQTQKLTIDDVLNGDEVILCNSVFGVSPVIKLIQGDRVKHWPIGGFCQQAIQLQNEVFASS